VDTQPTSLEIIQRLGAHHFIDDLAAALEDMSAQVSETGNKAKVTVVFTLETGSDDGEVVIVKDEIKNAPPAKESHATMFFSNGGRLYTSHQNQGQVNMFVEEVDEETGEVLTKINTMAISKK
jgi:hypothetical protein